MLLDLCTIRVTDSNVIIAADTSPAAIEHVCGRELVSLALYARLSLVEDGQRDPCAEGSAHESEHGVHLQSGAYDEHTIAGFNLCECNDTSAIHIFGQNMSKR